MSTYRSAHASASGDGVGTTPEHVPARTETIVAHIQAQLRATADVLPAYEATTAGVLRGAADELPVSVRKLGEAFDASTATSSGWGVTAKALTEDDPFMVLRGAAQVAVGSIRGSLPKTEQIVYIGVDGKKQRMSVLSESYFRREVRRAFTLAHIPQDKEPGEEEIADQYAVARASALQEVETEIESIFTEEGLAFDEGRRLLREQILSDALHDYFEATRVRLGEIRRLLRIGKQIGAVALSGNPSRDDADAALGAASLLRHEFGSRQHEQIKTGRKLFEAEGVINPKRINGRVFEAIQGYRNRLNIKLGLAIRAWITAAT